MIEAQPSQSGESRSFRLQYHKKVHEYRVHGMPAPIDYIAASDGLNGLVYASLKDLARPVSHFVTAFDNEAVDLKLAAFVKHLEPVIEEVNGGLQLMANQILRRTIFGDVMAANQPQPVVRHPREAKYRDTDDDALAIDQATDFKPSPEETKEFRLLRLSILKNKSEWLIDYYRMNMTILEHLLRKLGRDISLIEADVISMALRQMIKNDQFNVLLGGFVVLEVLNTLDQYSGELLKAAGSWLTLDQRKLVHDVEKWCEIGIEQIVQVRKELFERFLPTEMPIADKLDSQVKEGQTVEESFTRKQKEVLDKLNKKISESIKSYNDQDMQNLRSIQMSRYQSPLGPQDETPRAAQARKLLTNDPSPLAGNSGSVFFESEDEAYVSLPKDLLIDSTRPYIATLDQSSENKEKKVEVQMDINVYIAVLKQFLYNVFYYCQIPTFLAQLKAMDAPPFVVGFIFCLTPFAAGFADIGFNYMIRQKYRRSLVASFLILQLAILVHILGAGYNYIWLLILSRLIAGCSEDNVAVNTYLAREAVEEKRLRFGYLLVTSYAVAIGFGSGLTALLVEVVPEFSLGSLKINDFNITQVVLLLAYLPTTLVFVFFFKDHDQATKDIMDSRKPKIEVPVKYYTEEYPYNLSFNFGIVNLPEYCSTLEIMEEKISEDKAKIKHESMQEKKRLAKRYFAREQVHYMIKYLCCVWIFIEAIIIDSPFYLVQVKDVSPAIVGLFFFCQLALLPLSSWVFPMIIKKKAPASALVRYLTIALIVALLMRIQWSSQPYPYILFMLLQVPLLCLSLFGAAMCMAFLNELASDIQVDKAFGTGFIRSMVLDWGRFSAGVIISLGAAMGRHEKYQFTNNFFYPLAIIYMVYVLWSLNSVKSRLDYKKL